MLRRCFFGLLALSVLAAWGCSKAPDVWKDAAPGQLKVMASFPPIYCFVANVAGEQAKVLCLLTGKGPHDYSATHLDSLKVAKADLIVANGLQLDGFVAKLAAASGNRNRDVIFKIGDALPDDKLIHLDEHERVHVHEDGSQCSHGEHDPHLWLGPDHAILMVKEIAKKLGSIDPPNQKVYDDNASAYIKKIEELRTYGLAQLKDKKSRRIVATHDSLRYFAQTFGLEVVGSIQPQPGIEADAGKLAKLAQACKEKDIHAIIVEPQYSRGAAESLQRHLRLKGLDVRIVEFDPMETAQPSVGGNPEPGLYLSRMKENIDNLAKALP